MGQIKIAKYFQELYFNYNLKLLYLWGIQYKMGLENIVKSVWAIFIN